MTARDSSTTISAALEAAPEQVGMSSARLERVTNLVSGYVADGKIPGAISMVARGGKLVHAQSYGQMDVEADKPMQADTIFRIYSMTKPIASVALMMLYEEGRFQLDDPVSRFVPKFADLQVFDSGSAGQLHDETASPGNDHSRRSHAHLRPGFWRPCHPSRPAVPEGQTVWFAFWWGRLPT